MLLNFLIFRLDVVLPDWQLALQVTIRNLVIAIYLDFWYISDVVIYSDGIVLTSTNHGLAMHVNPETNAFMALNSLQHVFGRDIPQHNTAILTSRSNKRRAVQSTKATTNSEPFVLVALIRLFHAALYIIPQSNAVIKVESEDKAAVG